MRKFNWKDIMWILLGNFILAFAVGFFILPYHILSGGVAGLAVALSPLIHVSEELIVNCLVYGLFFVGWIVLGKQFALKTVISSLVYPVFLALILRLAPVMEVEPILASLYGGLIAGFGIGLVIKTGASTGGMDIPPIIVNKLTNIKISYLFLITDGLTLLLGIVAYDIPAILLGFISVFATSFAINQVMTRGSKAKAVQIISSKAEEISYRINHDLDRGTTITEVIGGYTQEKKQAILCVVGYSEYSALIELIDQIDPKAFLITTETTEVHGEGFSFGIRV